jgi:hypothetical protein
LLYRSLTCFFNPQSACAIYHTTLDSIVIGGQPLELVKCFKLLGIYLTSDLSWNTHVEYMCGKASKRLYIIRILKRSGFSVNHLRKVFCSFIWPILEYACPVWHFSLTLANNEDIEQENHTRKLSQN